MKSQKAKLITRAASALFLSVLLIFAVITYFNSSFGWFSRNKDVKGSGMGVNITQNNLDVEFEYLMYNVRSETYMSVNNLSDMEFNQYDLVFRSRNHLTPVVVRLAVNNGNLSAIGTLIVSIYRDTTKPTTETVGNKTQMSAFSSSVMRFTPFIGPTYYNADAETQFKNIHTDNFTATNALTGDDETSGSQVFTHVDYTGSTVNSVRKDDSLSFTFDYTQNDFVNGKLYVYVYITYDEGYNSGDYNGLTGIYSSTAGLTAIGAESVTFINDLVSIKVARAQ
ncbi:MAG: hypothetical protein J6Y43_02275 [Clostridia bacterium]|nr:hypothetical protein [Clostridia bacterium]